MSETVKEYYIIGTKYLNQNIHTEETFLVCNFGKLNVVFMGII